MQKKRQRRIISNPDLFRLYCAVLGIVLFQLPIFAADPGSNCPTDGKALDSQQEESKYRVVESKQKLLHKIVYDSSTAKRIEKSENNKAITLLNIARESLAQSSMLMDKGCLAATEQKLNDGLQFIQTASRHVVDSRRIEKISLQKYAHLRERTATFREAYAGIKMGKGGGGMDILDEKKLQHLIITSEEHAQKDDYKQANIFMTKAVNMIETALTSALDKKTLVHELTFDSIEDEYAYAMETNRSYKKLLKIILDNLDTSSSTYTSIEKLVKINDELLSESGKNAVSGNMEKALAGLEKGNVNLVRALSYIRIGQ